MSSDNNDKIVFTAKGGDAENRMAWNAYKMKISAKARSKGLNSILK